MLRSWESSEQWHREMQMSANSGYAPTPVYKGELRYARYIDSWLGLQGAERRAIFRASGNGGTISHGSLEQARGPRLFSQLIDQTKRLIFRVDRSIEDLDKVADRDFAFTVCVRGQNWGKFQLGRP